MNTIQMIDLIAVNPKICSGRPFYYEHKAEIDQNIIERRKLAAETKKKRVGSRHQPLVG